MVTLFLKILGAIIQRVLLAVGFLTLVFLGMCTFGAPLIVEGKRLQRDAVCNWADTLEVDLAGHVLRVDAERVSRLTLTDRTELWSERRGSGSYAEQVISFCLPEPLDGPLPVAGIAAYSRDAAALREDAGLAPDDNGFRFSDPANRVGFRDAPRPVEEHPGRLIIPPQRVPVTGVFMTAGVLPQGQRLRLSCWYIGETSPICRTSVQDHELDVLLWSNMQRVDVMPQDGAPVPENLVQTARDLRQVFRSMQVNQDPELAE